MKQLVFGIIVFLGVLQACRTPYDPEVPAKDTSFLVVEGYLDTQGLESELKLSRTVPLNLESVLAPETKAQVTLKSSGGKNYPLPESTAGTYIFENDIPESETYTLEIILQNGERYRSKDMRPLLTPDIIDAGFQTDEEGVEIFVTTQGDSNADDFLWTFEETWIYRPRIRLGYIYDPIIKNVRDRTEAEQIELCFKSEPSPDILLETSSRFEDQVVFRQTITEIPKGDERIMERYSILVSQKAIEGDAVKFWEILKKNTEDIGSIFSPLPSLIGGNIEPVDNVNTPVIGQVSLGVVRQKRIYIDHEEVSPWNYIDPEFNDCVIDQEPTLIASYQTKFASGSSLPARVFMPEGGTAVLGYFATTRRCADCTLYASPIKPDFWEDD